MSLERVLKDPRLVSVEHNGETLHFWHHRRMYELAKNHGYDPEAIREGGDDAFSVAEDILRYLWMCHLTFAPDLSFEEFDMMFLADDYKKLGRVAGEIQDRQLPKVEVEAEDAPKKAKGQSKKK